MFHQQKQLTQRTVNNLLQAATLIMSNGKEKPQEHEALHWQLDGKDYYCVPQGFKDYAYYEIAILQKKGSVFVELGRILTWQYVTTVLALHIFQVIKQPANNKPIRFNLTTPKLS